MLALSRAARVGGGAVRHYAGIGHRPETLDPLTLELRELEREGR